MRDTAILLALSSGFLTSLAAADVKVSFTLKTTDAYGAPVQENRFYYVTRPDNLPKTKVAPMVLVFDAAPGGGPASFFRRKAGEAGFLVVACSFSGNSTGTPGTVWNSEDPRVSGPEDYDYTTEVIRRVRESENAGDAFVAGLSKGGHMALAYACERPSMIKAAASVDEFMQLRSNIPSTPVPVIMFQGTRDTNVAYTMVKDTLDVWRAFDGLLDATPVTTYEASPLQPGRVTQTTWRGGIAGTQVAFVTIVGGTHRYATPTVETGYDSTDGMWTFFSQFLTPQDAPAIVSQPVNNVQVAGSPASFWMTACANAPVSYQWQKNGVDIPGANDNWYTTPPTGLDDDGASFRAVVTNEFGAATSAAATLSVIAPPEGPSITEQPTNQAVTAGQPVTFSVAAAGATPLTYQWKKNGIVIAGATDSSLTVQAGTSDSGAAFTVVVANEAGSTGSNPATLTVTPASGGPVILANPMRARVLVNQAATFSVKAWSASPMTYQWQKGTLTGNMADIPGATGATYTVPRPAVADHLTLLRCVVSNPAGSATSASEMLMVTAAPNPPTKITSPITAAAQVGAPFAYDIVSTGGTAPLVFRAGPLPAGLVIDADSGRIMGTPTEAGTTAITIEAANSAGRISMILNLAVAETPPPVSVDAWRFANFGASATNIAVAGDDADPDADGFTNRQEFEGGSNPLDPASLPES